MDIEVFRTLVLQGPRKYDHDTDFTLISQNCLGRVCARQRCSGEI